MGTYYLRSPQTGETTPGTGTFRGKWTAATAYAVGDRVFPTTHGTFNRCYEVTTGGTSGGTEPTWQTGITATTNDNTVVYTCRATNTKANANIVIVNTYYDDIAGDVFLVASDHYETYASNSFFGSWAGSINSPTRIICIDWATDARATGATIESTASTIIPVGAGVAYFYGFTFRSGVGTGSTLHITCNASTGQATYENCNFELATTSTGSRILMSNSAQGSPSRFINCVFKFNSASQQLGLVGKTELFGCSINAAGVSPANNLFSSTVTTSFIAENCDWSALGVNANIQPNAALSSDTRLINCKLPSNWAGAIVSSTTTHAFDARMVNCDYTDTNYNTRWAGPRGKGFTETTLVKTGGASDGTTAVSWKMVTDTVDIPGYQWSFASLPICRWNDTVGSSVTVTIDLLHDSATALQNDEVWLVASYLGTSGVPLGVFATGMAHYGDTPADLASSSASWTTTGMSNPNKQKATLTFTPQEKGFIQVTVNVSKPSYTLYVDPKIQVS